MISYNAPMQVRAHSWPVGLKMIAVCLGSITLFALESPLMQGIFFLGIVLLYFSQGRAFARHGFLQLRFLWMYIAVVVIWHLFLNEPQAAVIITLRLVSAFSLANFVTLTSRLSDMMDVMSRLLRPFERLGLNMRFIEVATGLVLRFIPIFIERGTTIAMAWRGRSTKRIGWQIILPMFVSTIDDSNQVTMALRARGGIN